MEYTIMVSDLVPRACTITVDADSAEKAVEKVEERWSSGELEELLSHSENESELESVRIDENS